MPWKFNCGGILLVALMFWGDQGLAVIPIGASDSAGCAVVASSCYAVCKIITPTKVASGVYVISDSGQRGIVANLHTFKDSPKLSDISVTFQSSHPDAISSDRVTLKAHSIHPLTPEKYYRKDNDVVLIKLDDEVLKANYKINPMRMPKISLDLFDEPQCVVFAGYGQKMHREGFYTKLANSKALRANFIAPEELIRQRLSKIAELEKNMSYWQMRYDRDKDEACRVYIAAIEMEVKEYLADIHCDYPQRFEGYDLLFDCIEDDSYVRGAISAGDSGGAFYRADEAGNQELIGICLGSGVNKNYHGEYPIWNTSVCIPLCQLYAEINRVLG